MDKPQIIQVIINAGAPQRLDKALADKVPEASGLTRTRLARLIAQSAVFQRGHPVTNPRHKVQEGDVYDIQIPPQKPAAILPEKMALDILYEDETLLVVNKPAGVVVHPGAGNHTGTLVNGLVAHFGENFLPVSADGWPGIVHRIDKDTSGLLVVAKTITAHQALSAQFKAHSVKRTYRALCHNVPRCSDARLMGLRGVRANGQGGLHIATMLARHPHDRLRQHISFDKGKRASTHIWVQKDYTHAAAIKCQLETGRTHQIRAHMRYIGHALIGDGVYARAKCLPQAWRDETSIEPFTRQALHAETLGFCHPTRGEALAFTAPPPQDFQRLEAVLARLHAKLQGKKG